MKEEKYILNLKEKFESYSKITENSWGLLKSIVKFRTLEKDEILLRNGAYARNFYFICKGAIRAYIINNNGDIYNKNIFLENDFAGSKVSLLQSTTSEFVLEALEKSILISIDYKKYRKFINENDDLKLFYIAYLEKQWVIEKEKREISLVMENATERYLKLLEKHPGIDLRIQKLHIASHLGITPTQLSRIRNKLNKKG